MVHLKGVSTDVILARYAFALLMALAAVALTSAIGQQMWPIPRPKTPPGVYCCLLYKTGNFSPMTNQ